MRTKPGGESEGNLTCWYSLCKRVLNHLTTSLILTSYALNISTTRDYLCRYAGLEKYKGIRLSIQTLELQSEIFYLVASNNWPTRIHTNNSNYSCLRISSILRSRVWASPPSYKGGCSISFLEHLLCTAALTKESIPLAAGFPACAWFRHRILCKSSTSKFGNQ